MDLWLFDNDGTLYDEKNAHERFTRIVTEFVSKTLFIPHEKARHEIADLKNKWKTSSTLIALKREYGLIFDEMVEKTYLAIDLTAYDFYDFTESARMTRDVLQSLDGRKAVFTNNPSQYARHVLSHLGILELFDDIIGIKELKFYPKPAHEAYIIIENKYRECDRIIFCDDNLKNVNVAQDRGWTTIWYCPYETRHITRPGQHKVRSLSEIPELKL